MMAMNTYLATIDVLDSRLTEYKIDVFTCLETADELRQIQPLRIVLIGANNVILVFLQETKRPNCFF